MDVRALLALTTISGLGPVTWRKLSDVFGQPESILSASYDLLRKAGASEKVAKGICSFSDWATVDRQQERLSQIGAGIVAFGQPEYPQSLVRMHDPPMVLFVKGTILPTDELAVSVVGTRNPGGYGKRIARKLAFQIASSGGTIVSGLALGIDTQAHRGALDAGGRTLAVLGSGLDVVSPQSNRELARVIAENGAVISEFPPGTEPMPGNFPRRNRIIAGLGAAVLVVEMPEKSGAGITARFALDQNKDVLVVPGPIDSPNFAGSHQWIRDGARPVFDAVDVLQIVLPESARRMQRQTPLLTNVKQGETEVQLPKGQAQVLNEIGLDPIHIDRIVEATGLTTGDVLTILLELELNNLVRQLPGKLFCLFE